MTKNPPGAHCVHVASDDPGAGLPHLVDEMAFGDPPPDEDLEAPDLPVLAERAERRR